jgi:hemolysin-activating ACP:hemolysin acyltransferase
MFLEGNYKLMPEDWRSGNVLIFADAIAPFGHIKKLSNMCRDIFPNYPKAEWRRHSQNKRVAVSCTIRKDK